MKTSSKLYLTRKSVLLFRELPFLHNVFFLVIGWFNGLSLSDQMTGRSIYISYAINIANKTFKISAVQLHKKIPLFPCGFLKLLIFVSGLLFSSDQTKLMKFHLKSFPFLPTKIKTKNNNEWISNFFNIHLAFMVAEEQSNLFHQSEYFMSSFPLHSCPAKKKTSTERKIPTKSNKDSLHLLVLWWEKK